MVNYFYDCYVILNKVYSEKAFIKQAINSTFIEESNRSAITKTVYGVLDKDIELSYYIKYLCDKTPKLVIRTILKIAMYNIKFLGKKDYAVVQNSVELTKKLGKSGIAGFVNAFLRKFISHIIPFPENLEEHLSIEFSYPLFAVKSLIKTYGVSRTKRIISCENVKKSLSFYSVNGEEYLKNKNVDFEKTPFNNVFTVKNFVRNEDYDRGVYTYQALGSVAICELVDACDNILDCCAAPGGKSVRLSYKCKNVVSWDIHEHRVSLIKDYCFRMNRENVNAFCKDAKVFDKDFLDKFDAVLCDAPCSGLGVVSDNPDIKLNRDKEDIALLNNEQTAILNTVCKYVKKGGFLYYSTCSVLDEENIDIVNRFLKTNQNFQLQKVCSPLMHEDIFGTNAFLPDISDGLGFYFAKFRRID